MINSLIPPDCGYFHGKGIYLMSHMDNRVAHNRLWNWCGGCRRSSSSSSAHVAPHSSDRLLMNCFCVSTKFIISSVEEEVRKRRPGRCARTMTGPGGDHWSEWMNRCRCRSPGSGLIAGNVERWHGASSWRWKFLLSLLGCQVIVVVVLFFICILYEWISFCNRHGDWTSINCHWLMDDWFCRLGQFNDTNTGWKWNCRVSLSRGFCYLIEWSTTAIDSPNWSRQFNCLVLQSLSGGLWLEMPIWWCQLMVMNRWSVNHRGFWNKFRGLLLKRVFKNKITMECCDWM